MNLILGRKVVSRRITVSDMLSVNNVLQRRVTIWDNLNANDYDQRRLCLGPFSGRSSNLSSRISGMLINPNCEFELNFIPLNTLGQWFESLKINEKRDQIDDDDRIETLDIYQVDKAFQQSLIQWLPEFNKIKSANDSQQSLKVNKSSFYQIELTRKYRSFLINKINVF
jgi:protein O-GlcNAcase/histone acetyltransferase